MQNDEEFNSNTQQASQRIVNVTHQDTDELKARSVELAERAFRLRDRATDDDTKEKLHSAGNELIMVENRQRFYDAQRILELGKVWTEDQRALAHEINVADRTLRGTDTIPLTESLKYVYKWTEFAANDDDETNDPSLRLNESLQILSSGTDNSIVLKNAINFILTYLEDVLQYAHDEETARNEMTDPLVIIVRSIRDSFLVHRELLYDETELLNNYKTEGEAIERLGLARHHVDELYK